MTVAELTSGVQFTVDRSGQITAVVLTPELWQRIVDALADAEDRALVQSLKEHLKAGPLAAGALRWEEVREEWQ
jgi:hypothetical protein